MRLRGSMTAIHFIISKTVSAVRADVTEVPIPTTKSSSTYGLAATGRYKVHQTKKNSGKKIFYAILPPEIYAESIGEIRF